MLKLSLSSFLANTILTLYFINLQLYMNEENLFPVVSLLSFSEKSAFQGFYSFDEFDYFYGKYMQRN